MNVIWDVTLCGSCKNRRFEGTYLVHNRGEKQIELGIILASTSN
jgi:hypothetical protein